MTAIKNEVILMGYDSVTGKSVQITVTGNAAKVTLNTAIAGETNPNSSTNAYLITRSKSNLSVISKTTAVTIGGGAAGDALILLSIAIVAFDSSSGPRLDRSDPSATALRSRSGSSLLGTTDPHETRVFP